MDKNKFKQFLDERGSLIPIEFNSFPFMPIRAFVVSNVPKNTIRGNHSHYTTKQYLLCLEGKIEVTLHDGINESKILLEKNEGVLVSELIFHFSIKLNLPRFNDCSQLSHTLYLFGFSSLFFIPNSLALYTFIHL